METITVKHGGDWNRNERWDVTFPLTVDDISNAIAIMGWLIVNQFPDRHDVHYIVDQLRDLPWLNMPADPRGWFLNHAKRVEN